MSQTTATTASANGGAAILRTEKATIRFGGLVAVKELDMDVRPGEIYGLIGPNGAGKTTVFNLLTGVYEPTSGEIFFQDKPIHGLRPYQIAARGVSRTFQNIRLFAGMTVLENVMTACHIHVRQTLADAVLRTPRYLSCWKSSTSRAFSTKAARACPMAASGGLRSCALWPRARSFYCWTSLPPG
jgi:ABC-type branched-subunit amino acid transport system ATPase component